MSNYEYNIIEHTITNIDKLFNNNIININNYSFIILNSGNLSYKTDYIQGMEVEFDSQTVNEIIRYIKNFFNYDKFRTNDCEYIFDTGVKLHTNLNKFIKENYDDEDDEDDDDDDDENNDNPSIRTNLYDKIGKHIKPFENAFDPHSSNEIIINDSEIYNKYNRILEHNFNYNFNDTSIDDNNYSIKKITRKNFNFNYMLNTTTNSYLPSIKLIKINSTNFRGFFNKIKKFLDISTSNPTNLSTSFKSRINNSNDYLIIESNSLSIVYEKSFNSISNLKETIKKLINYSYSTDPNKINDLNSFIDSSSKFCNNNLLNILTIYLIIVEDYNLENIINILLDLKKAGDWGQSLFCSKLNQLNRNNKCFFISGDQLSSVRSILSGNTNTIFSCRGDLGLFKTNPINTFGDFHNFLKENIYNNEIFKDIFSLYDNIINNDLFFANQSSLSSINSDTIINNTNFNFVKLYKLLLILYQITIIYLYYNSVIRYDNDNKLIKNTKEYIPNKDKYIEFFNEFNDIDIRNIKNINNLFENNDIDNFVKITQFFKTNYQTQLINYDSYIKIFNSFTQDCTRELNIVGASIPNDINIFVTIFLNFIDIVNIYNILLCYDRSDSDNFKTIIKNKQINYSNKICDLLSKLEFINYNYNNESMQFTQLDYYDNQKEYYNKSIKELNKFELILNELITYIPQISQINQTNPNNNFIISYNNYSYIKNQNSTNIDLINNYKYYKIKIILDLLDNIDLWKTLSNLDNIIYFLLDINDITNIKKTTKKIITINELFNGIDDSDFKNNINNNYYNFTDCIQINSNNYNITLYKFTKRIIDLFLKNDIDDDEKKLFIKLLTNIIFNVPEIHSNINNTRIPAKIIKLHNEIILPYSIYNQYKTPTNESKKNRINELLINLYSFNLKEIKFKGIINDNDFTYEKFINAKAIKIKDNEETINNINNIINQIKYKNYINIFLIYLYNPDIDLLNQDFNIRSTFFDITRGIISTAFGTERIKLLNAFNYFIVCYYLRKNKGINIIDNQGSGTTNDINNLLNNNGNYVSTQIYDYIYNDDNKNDNMIIKYSELLKYFKEFHLQTNKRGNLRNKYYEHKEYFSFLIEKLKLDNKFTLDYINRFKFNANKENYGYIEKNFAFLKENFEKGIKKQKLPVNESNILVMDRKRKIKQDEYRDNGILFLIDGYSTALFNIKKSISSRDLFKYISVNSFIIKELLEILNLSSDNIFELLKKIYQKYDTMSIKDIAIEYYKKYEDNEFKINIFEIIYIFLKGVISFYDNMLNMRYRTHDLNVKLYNSKSSKELKNILSIFDNMIKYTTSSDYTNIPTINLDNYKNIF